MKTYSDQNKSTSSRVNANRPFFSGKGGNENSFFAPQLTNIQKPEFFTASTLLVQKQNDNEEVNNKLIAIAKSIYEEIDSWGTTKDEIITQLQHLKGDTSKLNYLSAIYLKLFSISLEAHIRSEFSGDDLDKILEKMKITSGERKSYIGGEMVSTDENNYKKANSFKELIILVKAAEDKLISNGIIDVFDRIKIIRGIYYGTTWSMDYLKEGSEERNLGFDVYIANTSRPQNPTGILGESLTNALRNSPEIKDGNRSVDFGHLIIGLEARSKAISREISIPYQGGSGLEITTWLGDIGGGAGMLAMRRRNNSSIKAKSLVFNANGHDYGAKINLEGDIAAYVVSHDKDETDDPSYPNIKEYGFISDVLEDYFLPKGESLSEDWNHRVKLFTQMIGGEVDNNQLVNKSELIEDLTEKIVDFAGIYALIRYQSNGQSSESVFRETSKHIRGASKEVAQIFVEMLEHIIQNEGAELIAISNPAPSPKGAEEGVLKKTADTMRTAKGTKEVLEDWGNDFNDWIDNF